MRSTAGLEPTLHQLSATVRGFEPRPLRQSTPLDSPDQLAFPAHPKHKAAMQEIWRLRFANKQVYPDKKLLDMWGKAECPPREIDELELDEIRKRELDI